MDLLVEESKKEQGSKKINEELKERLKMKQQEHLKTIGKISSARLVANNHYVLDENIQQRIVENNNSLELSKAQSKGKDLAAKKKRDESLNTDALC
jgi:hypothetical protein